ncbi:MAG: glutathione S-transferase N-terminal domain-containing protein [Sphingomonadales bacterium]
MIELYFWTTPNGYKPLILLEELGLDYKIKPINISQGDQFKAPFVKDFPNSKIPALKNINTDEEQVSLFESGAILLYLAEKSGRFIPKDEKRRAEVLQWLFWQMGGLGPMLGQKMHFSNYAPEKINYAINRFSTEAKRLYDVLNQALANRDYVAGDYSIADIAIYPWVKRLEDVFPELLEGNDRVRKWLKEISQRPAVKRAYEIGGEINTTPTINKDSRKHLIKA